MSELGGQRIRDADDRSSQFRNAILGHPEDRARDTQRRDDSCLAVENRRADAAHAQFDFLVVDGKPTPADPRQLDFQCRKRRDGVACEPGERDTREQLIRAVEDGHH